MDDTNSHNLLKKDKVNSDKPENKENGLSESELVKKENLQSSESEIPFDESDLPPRMRQEIHKFFSMMISKSSSGFPEGLAEKVQPEHISQVLANAEKDSQRSFSYATSNRFFNLAYFVIGFTFLVIFLHLFAGNDKDFLKSLIELMIAFAAGFGVGWGTKKKD